MKFLKIGLLFLVGVVQGAGRGGVRFAEEPEVLEKTGEGVRRDDQGPRSILVKEGAAPRQKGGIRFNEASVVKAFPAKPAQEEASVVSPTDSGDGDRALTEKQEAAIGRIAQEDRPHRDEERRSYDVASQDRIDDEMARVRVVLEQIMRENPHDETRIREVKEYLTALANEADFLRFVQSSEKFKDVQFSQSKLEDLFVAFDFPDISDAALREMDRHELSVITVLGGAEEKSVVRKAGLTGEQTAAVTSYVESRASAAKSVLEKLIQEQEKVPREQADGIARVLIQEIGGASGIELLLKKIEQGEDISEDLEKWTNFAPRIKEVREGGYLDPMLSIRLEQELLEINKLNFSPLEKLNGLLQKKEPADKDFEEALSLSLQFPRAITDRVLQKMMEQKNSIKDSEERERISKQVLAMKDLFTLRDLIKVAESDPSKLFEALSKGENDPSLSVLVGLDARTSSLEELFKNEDLRAQLEGYKEMSLDLTKAVHLEAFLFRDDSSMGNTIDPEKLANVMVTALETSDVVTELVAQKIEKRAGEVIGLPKETQTSLRQMASYARSFVKLRQEVQQALQNGDMVALQKLQDQLRDLYERTFQDSFHDTAADILRVGLQKMTNQILGQMKEKLATMQGLITPPLKGVALVKYKFKRFFTYARTALRGKRLNYASEMKANKDGGFGLQTVAFNAKARVQGYVETAGVELRKDNPTPQVIDAIHNEFSALAGIRDLRGVVSPKEAEKSLNWADVNMTDDSFILKMTAHTGSEQYRNLARMLLERTTALGEEHDSAQRIAGKIFPLPDGRGWQSPTSEEAAVIKTLFDAWRNSVIASTKRTTIESVNPQVDLTALQILAEYQGASPAFVRLLQTKETALYALRAFSYEKTVRMPLQEAQLAFKFAQQDETLEQMLKAWELVGSEKSGVADDRSGAEKAAQDKASMSSVEDDLQGVQHLNEESVV